MNVLGKMSCFVLGNWRGLFVCKIINFIHHLMNGLLPYFILDEWACIGLIDFFLQTLT